MVISSDSCRVLDRLFTYRRRSPLMVLAAVCILACSFWIAMPSDGSGQLPRPVASVLRNAEEWHVYYGLSTESGGPGLQVLSDSDAINAFEESAEHWVASGDELRDLKEGVLEAFEDWPTGDVIIVASLGWDYLVQAKTKREEVSLLFKSSGEAVTYRSSFLGHMWGRLNLMESWREPFERWLPRTDTD